MSSWKTCSVIIVINLFLLWMASFIVETVLVTQRIESVNETLPTAIETALNTALQSEEMFGEGSINFDSKTGRQQNITYYNGESWISTNIYTLARALYPKTLNDLSGLEPDKQLLPTTSESVVKNSDLDSGDSDVDFCSLFAWAFADDESAVKDAGTGKITMSNEPNKYFKNFFDSIGNEYKTRGYISIGDNKGFIASQEWDKYSTLEQTGFQFNDDNTTVVNSKKSGKQYVPDGESVVKEGKTKVVEYKNGNAQLTGAYKNSTYMLTPYSLGITYLDPRVTKTVIAANIIKTMQMQAINVNTSSENLLEDLKKTYQPLSFDSSSIKTASEVDHPVINNGQFEVNMDLNSIKVNIEYANVNFFDESKNNLVNTVQGYKPGTLADESNTDTVKGLIEKNTKKLYNENNGKITVDTTTEEDAPERGNRVVAKVTVSLDVDIPYSTPFMRWVRGRLANLTSNNGGTITASGENHFGVLNVAKSDDDDAGVAVSGENEVELHVDPSKINKTGFGKYDFFTNSLKYQYTTYVAITG